MCIDTASVSYVDWSGGKLNITVAVSGKNAPQALGHFTFDDGKGHYYRFLHHPVFVNGHVCDQKGEHEDNPFMKPFDFDPNKTPPNGTTVGVWISIYWNCYHETINAVECCSQDVYYPSTVNLK